MIRSFYYPNLRTAFKFNVPVLDLDNNYPYNGLGCNLSTCVFPHGTCKNCAHRITF